MKYRKIVLLKKTEKLLKKISNILGILYICFIYITIKDYYNYGYEGTNIILYMFLFLGIPLLMILFVKLLYLFIKRYNKKNGIY
jgi:hypothetical protein